MRTIAFLLTPGFPMIALAPVSVFAMVNFDVSPHPYDVRLISEEGGLVAGSFGARVETAPFSTPDFDTLLVTGPIYDVGNTSPRTLDYIGNAAASCRRIGSLCTGAFLLAEAGLLDGRQATTHWHFAPELQARYPKVRVDADRIFINDRGVWTSAGASAGIDLCLGLVQADLGAERARHAARRLVLHHRRAGGQSQHSTLLELEATGDRIEAVLEHARRNLRAPLTVEELAGVARLSPRQFSRVFQQETGQSPAKAVEGLRLQAARMMLENTNRPIEAIADDAGFGDPERMRRAFLRAFSQPPQAIRRSAQAPA